MSNVAGKAYGMNVLTPMKPWKTWINTLLFRFGRLVPRTLSGLLGLSLIHFARWVMIRRKDWPDLGQGPQDLQNDYMLFCSNFNGTWDQYIDAFSDGIPNGLDLFWYSSTKYPQSIPITPFKDYILNNQIDTSYYYNATPGSAQRDIKAALRVFPELKALAARQPLLVPQQFAEEYHAALVRVQNDLGSPGYAPVASSDTREADWNREPFVHRARELQQAKLAAAPLPAANAAPARPARSDQTSSFDGGHYFLTVLVPVQNQYLVEHYGVQCSAVQRLRDVLATLPTALQSRATEAIGLNSPFARNLRTHLARFVVINDVQYNGREATDPIGVAIRKTRPTDPQKQDRLATPFLLFSADIDAVDGKVETLRGYLGELWSTMQAELRAIFENCYGFERVRDAATFGDYILACEVATTMPFNDYWPGPPPLKMRLLVAIAPGLIMLGLSLVIGIVLLCSLIGAWPAALLTLAGIASSLYIVYRGVLALGGQPFPAAPNADLPSVLKALYVQQQFTRHVIATQGLDDDAICARFAQFVAVHRLDDLRQPTQPPGVVGLAGSAS